MEDYKCKNCGNEFPKELQICPRCWAHIDESQQLFGKTDEEEKEEKVTSIETSVESEKDIVEENTDEDPSDDEEFSNADKKVRLRLEETDRNDLFSEYDRIKSESQNEKKTNNGFIVLVVLIIVAVLTGVLIIDSAENASNNTSNNTETESYIDDNFMNEEITEDDNMEEATEDNIEESTEDYTEEENYSNVTQLYLGENDTAYGDCLFVPEIDGYYMIRSISYDDSDFDITTNGYDLYDIDFSPYESGATYDDVVNERDFCFCVEGYSGENIDFNIYCNSGEGLNYTIEISQISKTTMMLLRNIYR